MKLFMLCGVMAVITCASSSVEGDILLEINAKFQRLEAENAMMKAKIARLEEKINATTAGKLEFFVDGRTVCPDDMVEVNATKGMVLLGRPNGGKTGAVFNRPLDAGEVGRSPSHSHAVTVDDPGHTHVGLVVDPGHEHHLKGIYYTDLDHGGGGVGSKLTTRHPSDAGKKTEPAVTNVSKTGIAVENLPAKSAVSVSVDANDAGEHLPLVYVLICQKVVD
jgi:hypothetical protein